MRFLPWHHRQHETQPVPADGAGKEGEALPGVRDTTGPIGNGDKPMTGTMYDSVNPSSIPAGGDAVAGYDDGKYAWPAEAWARFGNTPQVHIACFADPGSDAFDIEAGNAPADQVAAVVAGRTSAGKWSWVYVNMSEFPAVAAAFASKGVRFTDRSLFPQPGAYIWAADPSGNIASGAWRLPVDPVAVQTGYEGAYDTSELYVTLGATTAPDQPQPEPQPQPQPQPEPQPAPPTPSEVTVNVPVLSESDPGPNVVSEPVRTIQALLNLRHAAGLVCDGRFGPRTAAAVTAWEEAKGLSVDTGIAGPQVWTSLTNG